MSKHLLAITVAAVTALSCVPAHAYKAPVVVSSSGPFTALGGYAFGTAMAIPTALILRAGYVAYTENRQLTQKEANETFFGTLIPPLGVYYILRDASAKK